MKKTILSLLIASVSMMAFAQKKTSTSAIVAFDASTAIDNLPKAENKTEQKSAEERKTVRKGEMLRLLAVWHCFAHTHTQR